ncbi:MAG TPA: methyltransferase domain-containing protein [Bradyrhizobium sp.]|uniref:class I SAM-dependent methyltransferase n=1 Tax=Bradyrhizobium sp. TaxID=376 RepID=UPI002B46D8BA|nr:methyltransferase domain-containing protein [Bradyrhizobium sp.]HKO70751.1 methyltransferase domain-containing protein [Bradyrhizobium sp.]
MSKNGPHLPASPASVRAAEPTPHDVIWSPDRIQRFWDFIGSSSDREDTYFSKLHGRSLIDFVSARIPIGRAFDMGCGRGDLIGYLLEKYEASGADQSPTSVAEVNRKFGGHRRFRGAFVGTEQVADSTADTLFIVEVVEHLDDQSLASVLSEARRLLKPGGNLVLTTPNDENLEASKIMCPECACIFHSWQHVRSWTKASLVDYLREFGFEGVGVPTLLSQHSGAKRAAQRIVRRLLAYPKPHLVYVGSRTA